MYEKYYKYTVLMRNSGVKKQSLLQKTRRKWAFLTWIVRRCQVKAWAGSKSLNVSWARWTNTSSGLCCWWQDAAFISFCCAHSHFLRLLTLWKGTNSLTRLCPAIISIICVVIITFVCLFLIWFKNHKSPKVATLCKMWTKNQNTMMFTEPLNQYPELD